MTVIPTADLLDQKTLARLRGAIEEHEITTVPALVEKTMNRLNAVVQEILEIGGDAEIIRAALTRMSRGLYEDELYDFTTADDAYELYREEVWANSLDDRLAALANLFCRATGVTSPHDLIPISDALRDERKG